MHLLIDFGITKQINKIKKRALDTVEKRYIRSLNKDPLYNPVHYKEFDVQHMSSNMKSLDKGFEKRPLGISMARTKDELLSSPTKKDKQGKKGIITATVKGNGVDYRTTKGRKFVDSATPSTPPYDIGTISNLRQKGIDWIDSYNGIGVDRELHVLNPKKIKIIKREYR